MIDKKTAGDDRLATLTTGGSIKNNTFPKEVAR